MPNDNVQLDYMIPSRGMVSDGLRTNHGTNIGALLLNNNLDTHCLRPYIAHNGLSYMNRDVITNGKVQTKAQRLINNDATLRYLDWLEIDNAAIKVAKERMQIVKDFTQAGLVYRLPNGIAKTSLQSQTISDINPATISMDGLRKGESDRPVFGTVTVPIPIIHKDFQFSLREVLASRTGYSPLDLTTVELATRRVMEQAEQLVLGTTNSAFGAGQAASYSYGGNTIYGLMNWPGRITATITSPAASGWIPQTTVDDILHMKTLSQQAKHFGPWMVYCGLGWDAYMDDDYKPTYNDTTLRDRIKMIQGIKDVRTLDYIPDYSLIMVQMSTEVIRLINGMDVTVVQWESPGGFELNFKVMMVVLPQLRGDYNGNTGLVHGNV